MGILFFTLAALLTSISHILLKLSLNQTKSEYKFISRNVFLAGLMFILVTLISITGYKYIALKYGIILSNLSYIFVVLFSNIILKEKISSRVIVGSILIISGIIVFSSN